MIYSNDSKIEILDPCTTLPCGPQGRCIGLSAAPKGYMCMCQTDGVTFTTIDTCPSILHFMNIFVDIFVYLLNSSKFNLYM